jgi:hypothetical protein
VDRLAHESFDRALSVVAEYSGRGFPSTKTLARHWLAGRVRRHVSLTDVYCAELVAVTYERMGLLGADRPPNWYDPGTFWSGDRLQLVGAELGHEIQEVPPAMLTASGPIAPGGRLFAMMLDQKRAFDEVVRWPSARAALARVMRASASCGSSCRSSGSSCWASSARSSRPKCRSTSSTPRWGPTSTPTRAQR